MVPKINKSKFFKQDNLGKLNIITKQNARVLSKVNEKLDEILKVVADINTGLKK